MKKLAYALYAVIVLIVFIPKEKLYYTFETALMQMDISLQNETLDNLLFYIHADNGEIASEGKRVGQFGSISIVPWIFFNQIRIESITPDPVYKLFFPGNIEQIVFTHSFLHPFTVTVEGDGDFGSCSGTINLLEGSGRILFEPTQALKRFPLLVYKLHQEEEGLVYEFRY